MRALALLALALAACPASASDAWTTGDTQRETAYLALHALDWLQTRVIARDPRYHEINPTLGTNPGMGDINRYFALCAAAHIGISAMLPRGWRDGWQYLTIGYRYGYVESNFRLGVRIDFGNP